MRTIARRLSFPLRRGALSRPSRAFPRRPRDSRPTATALAHDEFVEPGGLIQLPLESHLLARSQHDLARREDDGVLQQVSPDDVPARVRARHVQVTRRPVRGHGTDERHDLKALIGDAENVVGGGRRRRRRGAEETFVRCVIGQANGERAHGPDGGDDPGRRETAVEAKREDGSLDVVAGDESKGVDAHARTRARRAVGTLRDVRDEYNG